MKLDDARIDSLARAASERRSVPSEELWARISASLDARTRSSPLRRVLVTAAATAALLLAVLELRPARQRGPLLGASEASALERELEDAEAAVQALLLRSPEPDEPFASELDYVDANLAHCRALAAVNPNNREVRRSLVRATRGKAHVLEELLASQVWRTDR